MQRVLPLEKHTPPPPLYHHHLPTNYLSKTSITPTYLNKASLRSDIDYTNKPIAEALRRILLVQISVHQSANLYYFVGHFLQEL
mmetsp:Transcript_24433/g.38345  ORF Transcript_24433/g.38345 Transcript_24433/m.38345 type:complete len:84 (-) Transcript_24433:1329-1580(-)